MIELLELLATAITSIISLLGYPGIFILMALESTATPVPSELVMPFAGYLASTGRFNLFLVILTGTMGCLFGSLASYYGGRTLGLPLIRRFGKYVLLSESDLDWTIRWFNSKGEKTIFISRFIPVVRHLISIPAGIGKMNILKFSIYTFLGSLIWVTILSYAGFALGENWQIIRRYTEKISLLIAALLLIAAAVFVWKHIKHFKKQK